MDLLSVQNRAEPKALYQNLQVGTSRGENRRRSRRSRAGAGPEPGLLNKVRKARTASSEQQLTRLERSFQNRKHLNVQDRMEAWYQNRRTKWRRHLLAGWMLRPPRSPLAPPTMTCAEATPTYRFRFRT